MDKEIIVAVPSYNNVRELPGVLDRLRVQDYPILVINDGSTDGTGELLRTRYPDIDVVTHPVNMGKGAGIRSAFDRAYELGYRYVVTIDSDGQHYPEDLPLFVEKIGRYPDSLLVGARNLKAENMPAKNTFANNLSNFFFRLISGQSLEDTQTGYRLYPIRKLRDLKLLSGKYEFEMEILVRAAWRHIPLRSVPIRVYYAPGEERISHFRPFQDFMRIVLLDFILLLIAIFWFYPSRLLKSARKD